MMRLLSRQAFRAPGCSTSASVMRVRGRKDKRGGRKVGEHRALTAEQEAEIRKLITDKTPDQLKLGFALWNRQAVRELIRDRCGVVLTPQGVGKYLARWGFTPQKPIRRAYE